MCIYPNYTVPSHQVNCQTQVRSRNIGTWYIHKCNVTWWSLWYVQCALRLESSAWCRSDIGKWCVAMEHVRNGCPLTVLTPLPDFKVGQEVLVHSEYFWSTQPSKKLSDKYFWPYPIIAQAGKQSSTLCLLDSMCAIHPIFHVSQLEPSVWNVILNCVQPPPPLVEIDGEPKFEISKILDLKIDNHWWTCKLLYLVHWSGYKGTDGETLWILATKLDHTSELVSNFHMAYPRKPSPFFTSM